MGHYDDIYDYDHDKLIERNLKDRMNCKRKIVDALRNLKLDINESSSKIKVPDRFQWVLEDFERWANEGLENFEKEQIVKNLKGK